MGRIDSSALRNWNNGETMNESDYEKEREIIRVAINDNYDRLLKKYDKSDVDGLLNAIKGNGWTSSITLKGLHDLIQTILGNRYTKTEVDNFVSSLQSQVNSNSSEIANLQTSKADEVDIYNRLASKTDIGTSYTKIESDGRYTRRIGDHQGTWQGLTPPQIGAGDMNASRIDLLESKVSDTETQTTGLQRGLSSIQTDQSTPYNVLNMKGRTLVNLLGRDGRLDKTGLVGLDNATETLITGDKMVGEGSIELTVTNTNNEHYATIGGQGKRYPIKPNTHHYVGGYVKPIVGQVLLRIVVFSDTGGVIADISTTHATDTTKWIYRGVKIPSFPNAKEIEVRCQISNTSGNATYTGAGEKGRFNGGFMYEITSSEYNKLDIDPDWTGDSRIHKFPYVDDMKSIVNPYVKTVGTNLLPPFYEWTLHANAKVISPYELEHITNTSGADEDSYVDINVVGGRTYPLSFINSKGSVFYQQFDSKGEIIAPSGTLTSPFNINVVNNAVKLRIILRGNIDGSKAVFTNPMLNIGDQPKPFEPQDVKYVGYDTTLRSNVDGTVFDELNNLDGKIVKTERFKEVVLDGSLGWSFDLDGTGFKRVKFTTPSNTVINGMITFKHDGKSIPRVEVANLLSDTFYADTGNYVISIADTDSGWGETYTPTADEIKAYFNGWRMYQEENRSTPYTSGLKQWFKIAKPVDSSVNVLPVASYDEWTPYRLQYQLTKPNFYEVQPLNGSIGELREGANQVEVGEGLIVRERVYPILNGTTYYLNRIDFPSSILKNRAKVILDICKNGIKDTTWSKSLTNPHGLQSAFNSQANYDPTAIYTVDYIAEPYAFTANATPIQIEYNTNLKTVVDQTVQHVADISKAVGVMDRTKANKEQMPWVTPTLLNGWVNYGNPWSIIGFYKDEFGIVHLKGMVKGGSVPGNILSMPKGYRPIQTGIFLQPSDSGGTLTISRVDVQSNGFIYIQSGGSSWLSLDGISFRAEQ